jgi:hypothetical protein
MAYLGGPEFKHQYCQKRERKGERKERRGYNSTHENNSDVDLRDRVIQWRAQ